MRRQFNLNFSVSFIKFEFPLYVCLLIGQQIPYAKVLLQNATNNKFQRLVKLIYLYITSFISFSREATCLSFASSSRANLWKNEKELITCFYFRAFTAHVDILVQVIKTKALAIGVFRWNSTANVYDHVFIFRGQKLLKIKSNQCN